MDNTTDCLGFIPQSTNDVAGIGVRVALYISIGLALLFAGGHNTDTFRDTARTSLITSTGLAIAGLISLNDSQGLSLVDGFCITTLTTLVMVFIICKAWPDKTEEEEEVLHTLSIPFGFSLIIALFTHTVLWTAFGTFLWTHVDTFGGAANLHCDPNPSIVFWVMGHNISATDHHLRTAALTLYSLCVSASFPYLILRCVRAWQEIKQAKTRKNKAQLGQQGAPLAPQSGLTLPTQQATLGSTQSFPMSNLQRPSGSISSQTTISPVKGQTVQRSRLAKLDRLLMSFQRKCLVYFGYGVFIYLVVTTEMIISNNGQLANLNQLSFGQILSLFLLLDQILSMCAGLPERARAWQERANAAQATAPAAPTTGPGSPANQSSNAVGSFSPALQNMVAP